MSRQRSVQGNSPGRPGGRNRGEARWKINLVSFALLCLLTLTGLTNWLILPRGYEARGGFWSPIRHFFVGVHEWAALLFIAVVAVHIQMHWAYVKANLNKADRDRS
jgi:hypothetical protein